MGWRAIHLYYHEDVERPLGELLRPLVAGLWRRGSIERFFFVRFPLGGPHLRLRCLAGSDLWLGELGDALDRYLRDRPSTVLLSEAEILRESEAILRCDANETDGRIRPDNSWSEELFVPEVERYGGPERFAASLDYFTLSSVQALAFLQTVGGAARSTRWPAVATLLLRQAWGFAAWPEEIASRLDYAVESWGEPLRGVLERADTTYAAQGESFRRLAETELRRSLAAAGEGDRDPLSGTLGARCLAATLDSAPPDVRRRVLGSHLHMSANRLGLKNPEEVFLCRLLGRAVRDSAANDPDLWKAIGLALGARAGEDAGTMAGHATAALDQLAAWEVDE